MALVKLFDDEDRHTQVADDLDEETRKAIASIFAKYRELGCSPREISHVMSWTVRDLELETVLKV